MQLAQTLKSASFRLAAGYVLLFTASVTVLAWVIYLLVTSQLNSDFRTRIMGDAQKLRAEYALGGKARLIDAMSARQNDPRAGGLVYALNDGSGRHLFGTLPSRGCRPGWMDITGPPDGDEPPGELEHLRIYAVPIGQGDCLLVGDDIGEIAMFGATILRSFGWGLFLTLTLGVLGGMVLSSNFLRRIETMNRTAEAIIEGDMTRRVPRRGSGDDLDRLAATLNRMLDRITILMESLRQVSNDVAHDLRTPLGRLRHLLEDANRTHSTREQYAQTVDRAIGEVDGILDTFGAILRIAQIESGARRSGFERLSLSDLVLDVCDTYAPSFEDSGKILQRDVDPDVWILGDRELLIQSLANLLENAISHTPAGTRATVSLRARRGLVELTVADDGPGVPEGECPRIFERFYRLEQSRSVAGNGLGLSIVAGVAELHSGKVAARSNNPGLRVDMTLPAAA